MPRKPVTSTETNPSTEGGFHLETFNNIHQSIGKYPRKENLYIETRARLPLSFPLAANILSMLHHLQHHPLILHNQMEWETPRGYMSVTCTLHRGLLNRLPLWESSHKKAIKLT